MEIRKLDLRLDEEMVVPASIINRIAKREHMTKFGAQSITDSVIAGMTSTSFLKYVD